MKYDWYDKAMKEIDDEYESGFITLEEYKYAQQSINACLKEEIYEEADKQYYEWFGS